MSKKKTRKSGDVSLDTLSKYAGSSDEDGDAPPTADVDDNSDAESESDSSIEHEIEGIQKAPQNTEWNEDGTNDAAAKMADVMSRILQGGDRLRQTSVVLSRTTTPLQRIQKQEIEQARALKKRRTVNREQNLTPLHVPLSTATTNVIEGRTSNVSRELERERYHRRVATRGVVALFNAISQHQKSSQLEGAENGTKSLDAQKLTKHRFLDEIKYKAGTLSVKPQDRGNSKASDAPRTQDTTTKWNALQEDVGAMKNWDQQSSDDEIM